MTKHFVRMIFALAGLLAAGASACAHPHVWVTMQGELVYAPDGSITGVRYNWTFDDMFSAFATQGIDPKKPGVFTREDLAPLAKENVTSLKDFGYFTFAKANGKNVTFVDPVDYHLDFDPKESVLTLHFLLPLKTPLKAKSVVLEVFDPSYFVDFALAEKDAVSLEQAPAGCEFRLDKPQEMTKELAQKLAEIPPDQQIPDNSYGAAFSNKISVKCP